MRGTTPVARGRYQITCVVWFQHTNRPWKLAHNLFWSDEVARRHLSWLAKNIPPTSDTTFLINSLAWAWRGGLTMWQQRETFPPEMIQKYNDYADRVTNLYLSLL